MKAQDLMIGDYVLVKPSKMLIKIVAVHRKKVAYHTCIDKLTWVREDLLEPILLTPEILEKNGFGFVKTDEEYRRQGGVWTGYWIYKGLELGVANLDHVGNWPCYINIYDSNIECKNVHQLQHALRLCQIEKEIIL